MSKPTEPTETPAALIARFEQKIQATLARVWGEAAPADVEKSAP
jgi:hypothetical protein